MSTIEVSQHDLSWETQCRIFYILRSVRTILFSGMYHCSLSVGHDPGRSVIFDFYLKCLFS